MIREGAEKNLLCRICYGGVGLQAADFYTDLFSFEDKSKTGFCTILKEFKNMKLFFKICILCKF